MIYRVFDVSDKYLGDVVASNIFDAINKAQEKFGIDNAIRISLFEP